MDSTKLTCRVCGKKYEPCRTAVRRPNVFHWQEVACSPECGEIYLQRIIESRKSAKAPGKSERKSKPAFIESAPAAAESFSTVAEEEFSEPSEPAFDTYAAVE